MRDVEARVLVVILVVGGAHGMARAVEGRVRDVARVHAAMGEGVCGRGQAMVQMRVRMAVVGVGRRRLEAVVGVLPV